MASNEAGRIVGHFWHGHFRGQLSHQGPLCRVVVDENQGVQADVEPPGDLAEVGRLIIPIGDETGDVIHPQHHLGVLLEDLPGDRLLVLAANGQQDAALLQRLGVLLEGHEGLALGVALPQADAAQAIVADDAAPAGVVQIEDQALLGQAQSAPPAPRPR